MTVTEEGKLKLGVRVAKCVYYLNLL